MVIALGWHFDKNEPIANGCSRDPEFDASYLKDLYLKADPNYSGRVTVPVLWDKETKTIVNNESADIIKMFNCEFNEFAKNHGLNLRPPKLEREIDQVNEWVYDELNNGVYKAGFATLQDKCTRLLLMMY